MESCYGKLLWKAALGSCFGKFYTGKSDRIATSDVIFMHEGLCEDLVRLAEIGHFGKAALSLFIELFTFILIILQSSFTYLLIIALS